MNPDRLPESPRTIEARTRVVFYAPTARRHYMSKAAAVKAEARALIKQRYPTEAAERDHIGQTYPGFHWMDMPRSDVLYRRVCRVVSRRAA